MSLTPWILAIIIWVVVQPFLYLPGWRRFRGTVRKYSTRTLSRLLIPFTSDWESLVRPEDLPELRRYRRFIMSYYYGAFLLPLIAFHISLWIFFIAFR
jgi:hypothetical protein